MLLEDYLLATRKPKGTIPDELNIPYNDLYKIVKKYVPFDLTEVELKMVYSTNKTAETIKINGKNYLIYDRYLGQVFNMLNRLHFNSSEPDEAWYYSYKLLAEEFQLSGRPDIGLILGLAYSENIDKSSTYKIDKDLPNRTSYTLLQETFVMVHELIHYSGYAKPGSESFETVRANTIDLINDRYVTKSGKIRYDILQSLLSDYHENIYGKDDSYKDFLDNKQINTIKADWDNGYSAYTQGLINILQKSDNVIEEIICDDLSVMILIEIMGKEFNYSMEKILNGAYLALLNLRTLGVVYNQVWTYFNGDSKLENFLSEAHIRLIRNRDKANYYYGLEKKDFKKGFEIQKVITPTNERYLKSIFDPIIYKSQEGINILKRKYENNSYDFDFDRVQDENRQLDIVLNQIQL